MEYLPEELLQEIVMKMPLKDVLEKRKLSKEWRDAIDKLWCRLLDRDFKIKTKDNCYNNYKKNFILSRYLTIDDTKIQERLNRFKKLNKELFYRVIKEIGFEYHDGLWYWIPTYKKQIKIRSKSYLVLFEVESDIWHISSLDKYDGIFGVLLPMVDHKIEPSRSDYNKNGEEYIVKTLIMKENVYDELFDRAHK